MKQARLLKNNEIVNAQEVLEGKIDRHSDFVDIDEEFRVTFVSGAKNNGEPYFRLYYSKKDYDAMSVDKKNRYDIVKEMRHYKETKWHKEWEQNFKDVAQIEKVLKNENGRYKRSDVYIEDLNLCLEFQHSYIAYDFENRNKFYNDLGIKIIWIYDLTNQIIKYENGKYIILENNSKGFFRIAEKNENLKNNTIFVQDKSKKLYQVNSIERKEINSEKESTIRYINVTNIFSENEFIEKVANKDINFTKYKDYNIARENLSNFKTTKCVRFKVGNTKGKKIRNTIYELWEYGFNCMFVENVDNGDIIKIGHKWNSDGMEVTFNGYIRYQYAKKDYDDRYVVVNETKYLLKKDKANEKKWNFLIAFYKNDNY